MLQFPLNYIINFAMDKLAITWRTRRSRKKTLSCKKGFMNFCSKPTGNGSEYEDMRYATISKLLSVISEPEFQSVSSQFQDTCLKGPLYHLWSNSHHSLLALHEFPSSHFISKLVPTFDFDLNWHDKMSEMINYCYFWWKDVIQIRLVIKMHNND